MNNIDEISKIIKDDAEDSELLLNPRWVRMVAQKINALSEDGKGCVVCSIRHECGWFKEIVEKGCEYGQFNYRIWRDMKKETNTEIAKNVREQYLSEFTRAKPLLDKDHEIYCIWLKQRKKGGQIIQEKK